MKIHLVQLEPLKERYTEWWETYIPEQLRSFGNEVNIITGETLSTEVRQGTVLDASGTNYYKAEQIKKIAKLFSDGNIKPGDRFLITDIWFPGVEAIRYMSDIMRIPVKIYGIWHAGSITNEDFMQPSHPWAKYFELGYLNICDAVFVGSEYSKESILSRLVLYYADFEAKEIANKIYAYGMPLDVNKLLQYKNEKLPLILFPHRFDIEKRPNIFLDVIEVIAAEKILTFPIDICFCTSRKKFTTNSPWLQSRLNFLTQTLKEKKINIFTLEDLSKEQYYNLVAQSLCVVSTTIEENFGYCIAEACALGTIPIVPNSFSYPEMLEGNEEYLYDDIEGLKERIIKVTDWWITDIKKFNEHIDPLFQMVSCYRHTVSNWNEIMKKT